MPLPHLTCGSRTPPLGSDPVCPRPPSAMSFSISDFTTTTIDGNVDEFLGTWACTNPCYLCSESFDLLRISPQSSSSVTSWYDIITMESAIVITAISIIIIAYDNDHRQHPWCAEFLYPNTITTILFTIPILILTWTMTCWVLISLERWATLLARVTTCDSSRCKVLIKLCKMSQIHGFAR